jgi:prepilin-type processing-associated H-X9-DG protein
MKTRLSNHVAFVAIAVLALGGVLMTAAPSAAAPLAEQFPATSLAYYGWAGKTKAFDQSVFGQMMAEPQLAGLLKSLSAAAGADAGKGHEQVVLAQVLAMAEVAWRHPAAAALMDVQMGQGGPSPSMALLLDLGEDRQAFDQHLKELVKLMPEPPKEQTEGSVTFQSVAINPQMLLVFGYRENEFFLGAGTDVVKKLLKVTAPNSLAASPQFTKCLAAVGGADQQAVFYLDVADIYAFVDQLMPPPSTQPAGDADTAAPAEGPKAKNEFRRTLAVIGLDKVTALAGTMRIVDRGMYTHSKLFSPAPFEGLLSPANAKPLTDADLAKLPADADFACVTQFSALDMLKEVRKMTRNHSGFAAKAFEDGLDKIEKETGVNLQKDILANLGETWSLSSAVSQGGFMTGTVLTVKVKDAQKLAAAIAKIETYLDQFTRQLPAGKTGGPGFPWKPSYTMGVSKYGNVDVHYLSSGMLMVAAPAWAIDGDTLYMAPWPQVVASSVNREAGKPLTQSAEFLSVRKRLADKPIMLCYENTPSMMKQMYGPLLMYGTLGASALKQFVGIDASPTIVPTIDTIQKNLGPSGSAVSTDEGGIVFESYSSTPFGAIATGPMVAGFAAGALVPAFTNARSDTQKASSMANLKGIGTAIALYIQSHDNKYPPDFQALIADGESPKLFISPISHRQDYVYIRLDSTNNVDGSLICAYERPENYQKRGTNVLYADGHVTWRTLAQFQMDLTKTQLYLAKNSSEQPGAKKPATKPAEEF